MRAKYQVWGVTAVLLVFACLYLVSIHRVMRMDEAYTVRNFTFSLIDTLFSYYAPNNHILHSMLVGISETFIGNSPVGVRFPTFVAGLIALALTYRIGKRASGHQAGLLALVLLGTNLTFADYSINARGYTLAICLTLLLIDLLMFLPIQPRRWYGWALLLTCCGLVLTLPSMILLLIGIGLWLLTQGRKSWWVLTPMIVGSTLAVLVYVMNWQMGKMDAYLYGFGVNDGHIPLLTLFREWLALIFATPVLALVFAIALPAGAVIMWRDPRQRSLFALAGWIMLSAWVLTMAQSILLDKVFFARNYLYLLAPLVLVAGIGLARLPKIQWGVSALIAVSILPLLQLGAPVDIDTLIARVDANLQAEDALVVDCCLAESTWYHLMRQGRDDLMGKHPGLEQVLIVGGSASLPRIIAEAGLTDKIAPCSLIDDGSWEPFEVYRCAWIAD